MSGKVYLTRLDDEGNPEGEPVPLGVSTVEIVWDYVPSEVDKEQAKKRLVKMHYSEEFDGGFVQYYMPCATFEEEVLKRLGEKFILTLGTDGDTILT